MKTDVEFATFLILERDPVVQMDIQEMLLRSFEGSPIVFVAGLSDLPRAMEKAAGPRILITSAEAESFGDGLITLTIQDHIAAVLIIEGSFDTSVLSIPSAAVQTPFNSEQLLTAVRTALGRLRSSL